MYGSRSTDLNLSCLYVVECVDSKYNLESFIVFDCEGNVVCIFPRGQYEEKFFRDLVSLAIRFFDTNLLALSSLKSGEYYENYYGYFGRRRERFKCVAYDINSRLPGAVGLKEMFSKVWLQRSPGKKKI
jgi:hypothetical protein